MDGYVTLVLFLYAHAWNPMVENHLCSAALYIFLQRLVSDNSDAPELVSPSPLLSDDMQQGRHAPSNGPRLLIGNGPSNGRGPPGSTCLLPDVVAPPMTPVPSIITSMNGGGEDGKRI